MKTISILLALAFVSACTPKYQIITEQRIIPLNIPSNLTEPCKDYPLLTGGTGKEVMLWGKEVLQSGVACKHRHDALSKIVIDYTKNRDSGVTLTE